MAEKKRSKKGNKNPPGRPESLPPLRETSPTAQASPTRLLAKIAKILAIGIVLPIAAFILGNIVWKWYTRPVYSLSAAITAETIADGNVGDSVWFVTERFDPKALCLQTSIGAVVDGKLNQPRAPFKRSTLRTFIQNRGRSALPRIQYVFADLEPLSRLIVRVSPNTQLITKDSVEADITGVASATISGVDIGRTAMVSVSVDLDSVGLKHLKFGRMSLLRFIVGDEEEEPSAANLSLEEADSTQADLYGVRQVLSDLGWPTVNFPPDSVLELRIRKLPIQTFGFPTCPGRSGFPSGWIIRRIASSGKVVDEGVARLEPSKDNFRIRTARGAQFRAELYDFMRSPDNLSIVRIIY